MTAALTDCLLEEGLPTREADPRVLRAGPVEVAYGGGFLRSFGIGGKEFLRMINFALRDANWGTVPFRRLDETLRVTEDAFEIAFRARFGAEADIFEAEIRISGDPAGRIEFSFSGRALADFSANRLGFTVLHPLEGCAGERVRLVHTDGSATETHFPRRVSPHQPFRDLAAMEWGVGGGTARLAFHGEVFETEDQRNWTDASYKTYCTPLERPFPVVYRPGDTVRQRLVLTVSVPDRSPPTVRQSDTIGLSMGTVWHEFPKMGFAWPAGEEALGLEAVERLRRLRPAHLRVDIGRGPADAWRADLKAAGRTAAAVGCALELALFAADEADVASLIEALSAIGGTPVARVLLFGRNTPATPPGLLRAALPALRARFQGARIGAGTDAFFAELNRNPVPTEDLDFISFSLNPQVHAFDRFSWVETLEAQGQVVASARDLAGGKGVAVSPVTFRKRWNPNATAPEPPPPAGQPPRRIEPRQLSLFAAGWTMGSMAGLASSGVESLTWFEVVGEAGLFLTGEPRYPAVFPLPPGAAFPLYFVFLEVAGAMRMRPLAASDPQTVSAMLVVNGVGQRLLAANHTPRERRLRLPEGFQPREARVLDREQWRALATDPGACGGTSFP